MYVWLINHNFKMGKIHELSKSSASLLTSSQIITSVHCIVKELIENAFDSCSKNVEVKLVCTEYLPLRHLAFFIIVCQFFAVFDFLAVISNNAGRCMLLKFYNDFLSFFGNITDYPQLSCQPVSRIIWNLLCFVVF